MKIKYIILFISIFISTMANSATKLTQATAIFAGGCFWCMQSDFDKVNGVIKTTVGYTGGSVARPSYEQVSSGQTGHYEAIQVIYNPAQISYESLLNIFWHNIDPTNASGQFCDTGKQYRAVIFYLNSNQAKLAEASKQQLIDSKKFNAVVTQILPATKFYPAEDYHQAYYKKNPWKYQFYRYNCGRDKRLNVLWNDK